MAVIALAGCGTTSAAQGRDIVEVVPAAPRASSPGAGATLTPVPSVQAPVLAPLPVGRAARVGRGVSVRLDEIASTRVRAHGVGEVAGPALAFTLVLRNASDKPVDLGSVNVTASRGGVPAVPTAEAPTRPLAGFLAPGASRTGVYAFVAPRTGARSLRLEVTHASGQPVAVFTGRTA